jgi:hypothetical protein
MYYYCYISETKVDQVVSQYYKGMPEKTTTSFNNSEKAEGSISASLLKLVDFGTKFGRDNAVVHSTEIRETRVSKLLSALQILGKRIKDLNELIDSGCNMSSIPTGMYLYSGTFIVASYDNNYAYLESVLTPEHKVQAVCSLQYFSETGKDKERFVPHSGNAMFFKGEFDLHFTSLLYVIKNINCILHATPLFLALPLDSEVYL